MEAPNFKNKKDQVRYETAMADINITQLQDVSFKIANFCASKCLTNFRNEEMSAVEKKCYDNCYSKYFQTFQEVSQVVAEDMAKNM